VLLLAYKTFLFGGNVGQVVGNPGNPLNPSERNFLSENSIFKKKVSKFFSQEVL